MSSCFPFYFLDIRKWTFIIKSDRQGNSDRITPKGCSQGWRAGSFLSQVVISLWNAVNSRSGFVSWVTNSCQQLRSAKMWLMGTWRREADLPICTPLIKSLILILLNKGAFGHWRNKSRASSWFGRYKNFEGLVDIHGQPLHTCSGCEEPSLSWTGTGSLTHPRGSSYGKYTLGCNKTSKKEIKS